MKCVTNLIIAKKEVWSLPSATGRWSPGLWNVLPITNTLFVWGLWALNVNSMIYDEGFGTSRISFNLDSNKKLNFLVQILGKGWRLTVTQAVHDGVPIKTLDTRDSGEIPIGDIPFGTLLDSAICISFFCWF